ncbi:tyrosine-type recombinase/integrase [Pleurocapsales cyanobacterium LEGE 06147]|nr:tyrosine-type recombinase/integrase [Pleurocapsales cyanobacterium LEGE 06147]
MVYAQNTNTRGFAGLEIVKSDATGKKKLRIRLPRSLFAGKSKYIALGLDDTPKNQVYAEKRIDLINSDILNDCFDLTLERYKPQAKKQAHIAKLQALTAPKIDQLYQRYIEVRKDQVSPNTYLKNYLHWLARLQDENVPSDALEVSQEGAVKLLEYLSGKYTNNANKRLFDQLNACCIWAIGAGAIKTDYNPYSKAKNLIPATKKKRKLPAYFSKEEIGQILQSFRSNQYYSHYADYVAFLFATGARPSEVVCLTWDDIDDRFVHFSKRVVESVDGKIIQEGLKSEDKRKFPINSLVRGILNEQKSKGLSEKLIFPSPTGKMIHIQNFSRRAWKTILSELEFKYKRPYCSRASFITHTLEHLDAKDVGRICGNLPETIYQHYASSNVASLIVPNSF